MTEEEKPRAAIKFSPSAKNNTIDKSKIYGSVEMDGEGNKITRSLIDVRRSINGHPFLSLAVTITGTVIAGIVLDFI